MTAGDVDAAEAYGVKSRCCETVEPLINCASKQAVYRWVHRANETMPCGPGKQRSNMN